MKTKSILSLALLLALIFFGCEQEPEEKKPEDEQELDRKGRLYARMENHIKAVFEHYGGDIEWWDVCNEVVDHDYYTNGGARRDSKYTEIMEESGLTEMDRYEYVLKAFQWARKYADENGGQNVKLYLTDYGVERPFTGQTLGSKQKAFSDLVDWLIEKGAPIDGVGFQGHFRLYDHPVEQIAAGIDLFAAKGLKVQICELDISIFGNAKGEGSLTIMPPENLSTRLADLANTYGDYFDMFQEKYGEGKLELVTLWGLADGHSWLNNHPVAGRVDYPLLFDRDYEPKAAYDKVFGSVRTVPIGAAVPGGNAYTSNFAEPPAQNDNNALNPESAQHVLLEHFEFYSAENEMKPENLLPASEGGDYRWANADALADYAEANGKKLRGHVLIWHSQTPAWFFE